MDIEQIKLIIWDLDDTFWDGVLSEEKPRKIEKNIRLVKELTKKGVVNSICSKNDFNTAKTVLQEFDIWDYFIFPHISWMPKGEQVKDIIDCCSLREENVLFIDDNISNLKEVQFYNNKINISYPNQISCLCNIKGKEDPDETRLKQYKILERKRKERDSFSTNDEFLSESNIKVNICCDCINHIDRIYDLMIRSNQLNYTKIRLSYAELKIILKDNRYYSGYVMASDKYGEYGIIGFFAIRDNMAEHFLFSCRTIGMGIEQYVYARLGCPNVCVKGEVRTELKKAYCPQWISEGDVCNIQNKLLINSGSKNKLLISGGCDLEQVLQYLHISGLVIDTDFNSWGEHVRHDHTISYVESKEIDKKERDIFFRNLSFINDKTFSKAIFNAEYDVVVISLLMDMSQGIYRHKKKKSIAFTFGDCKNPISMQYKPDFISERERKYILENFDFEGSISEIEFSKNLEYIRRHIDKKTLLILINGCEVDIEHAYEKDRYLQHKRYNKLIDDFIAKHNNNTKVLDMRKIVKDRNQLADNIRHYSRKTYFEMANQLSEIVNDFYDCSLICSRDGLKPILLYYKKRLLGLFVLLYKSFLRVIN